MSSHADALKQAKSLNKISDENLIRYFKTELILIGEGQNANTILSSKVIQKLIRMGVVEYLIRSRSYILTDKTLDFLQEISMPSEPQLY